MIKETKTRLKSTSQLRLVTGSRIFVRKSISPPDFLKVAA
jgi:hypothetical protein